MSPSRSAHQPDDQFEPAESLFESRDLRALKMVETELGDSAERFCSAHGYTNEDATDPLVHALGNGYMARHRELYPDQKSLTWRQAATPDLGAMAVFAVALNQNGKMLIRTDNMSYASEDRTSFGQVRNLIFMPFYQEFNAPAVSLGVTDVQSKSDGSLRHMISHNALRELEQALGIIKRCVAFARRKGSDSMHEFVEASLLVSEALRVSEAHLPDDRAITGIFEVESGKGQRMALGLVLARIVDRSSKEEKRGALFFPAVTRLTIEGLEKVKHHYEYDNAYHHLLEVKFCGASA